MKNIVAKCLRLKNNTSKQMKSSLLIYPSTLLAIYLRQKLYTHPRHTKGKQVSINSYYLPLMTSPSDFTNKVLSYENERHLAVAHEWKRRCIMQEAALEVWPQTMYFMRHFSSYEDKQTTVRLDKTEYLKNELERTSPWLIVMKNQPKNWLEVESFSDDLYRADLMRQPPCCFLTIENNNNDWCFKIGQLDKVEIEDINLEDKYKTFFLLFFS